LTQLSGTLRWKFDPKVWEYHPAALTWHYGVNRGVAYADGRLFVLAMDGRLFAVSARDGQELWHVDTLPPGETQRYVHGAPRVFKGKVVIGNGGADAGARGYVTAYDAATGQRALAILCSPRVVRRRTKATRRWSGPRQPGAESTGRPARVADRGTASYTTPR
jgi:quinohemoprotein ethanol dehydrogenase